MHAIRSKLSTADMDMINSLTLRPVTKEEIFPFELDVVNARIDRHFSRFPESELHKIARKIPRIPLMEIHETDKRLPIGKFFRANVIGSGKDARVRAAAYVPRLPSTVDMIANIEMGVYSGTSIGFAFDKPECSICGHDLRSCSHVPGREYDVDGKKTVCHFIMHDVSDVFEVSIVAVPSQRTEITSALRRFQGVH